MIHPIGLYTALMSNHPSTRPLSEDFCSSAPGSTWSIRTRCSKKGISLGDSSCDLSVFTAMPAFLTSVTSCDVIHKEAEGTYVEKGDIGKHRTALPIQHVRLPLVRLQTVKVPAYAKACTQCRGIVAQPRPTSRHACDGEGGEGGDVIGKAPRPFRRRTCVVSEHMDRLRKELYEDRQEERVEGDVAASSVIAGVCGQVAVAGSDGVGKDEAGCRDLLVSYVQTHTLPAPRLIHTLGPIATA